MSRGWDRTTKIVATLALAAVGALVEHKGHRVLIDALASGDTPLYVIDESDEEIKRLHARNIQGVAGSATTLLHAANPTKAAAMFVAIPSNFEAGQVIEQARIPNQTMPIMGRAQSEAEADYLRRYGASQVAIFPDTLADAMLASYRKSTGKI